MPHRPAHVAFISSPRKLAEGIVALAGGEISGRLIAFAATAWLTRRLGPAGFGVVAFATAISTYLLLAVVSGFNDIGSREVARQPERAATIAASGVAVRLVAGSVAWLALGVVAWMLPRPDVVRLVVFLSGLSFISQAIDTSWVYKGIERNTPVAIAGVMMQILYAVGVLAVVRGPEQVVWVPVLQFVGELGGAVWLGTGLFRTPLPQVTLVHGLSILRASLFLLVSRLLRVVILTAGVILLGLITGERSVGLFSAAYRVCFLVVAIVAAMNVAYLPSFVRAATNGRGALEALSQSALWNSVAVGAPLVIGGIVVAKPLLEFLFGSPYGDAAVTLQLLLFSVGCTFIYGTLHNLFVVDNKTHTETMLLVLAATIMLGVTVTLVPRLGLVGAGLGAAAAEAALAIGGWRMVRRSGLHLGGSLLAVPLGAGLVMAGTLLLLPPLPLFVVVAVGGVAYSACLLTFNRLQPAFAGLLRRKG